ncbi:MAG: cytosine deaminase, partial [Notoacmeibacter sp.]
MAIEGFPASTAFTLKRVRLHVSSLENSGLLFDSDGWALADLAVKSGKFSSIVPAGATAENDMAGRIVLPAFVDCHTHLDKGHIWPRSPNPDGSFMGALNQVGKDREANWSASDVATRMDFALRCAYAYGTKAMRTHLDCVSPQEDITWPVFVELREKWAGRVELQAACLTGIEQNRDKVWFQSLVKKVAAAGGVLGTVTYMIPDLELLLDDMFRAAMDHGLDLDFHADETDELDAISLRKIAEAAERFDYKGRILVGHCCALSRQPDDEVKRTLDLVSKRYISVVSLPMCNMYLQD